MGTWALPKKGYFVVGIDEQFQNKQSRVESSDLRHIKFNRYEMVSAPPLLSSGGGHQPNQFFLDISTKDRFRQNSSQRRHRRIPNCSAALSATSGTRTLVRVSFYFLQSFVALDRRIPSQGIS